MRKLIDFLVLFLALRAGSALAHSGVVHEHFHALQAGLLHPVTGIDHLLMLLGAGALAALTGRSLALPLATLAALLVGAGLGWQFGAFVGMESLIIASVLCAGLAIACGARQPVLVMLVPVLALAHGWAHGVEAPSYGALEFFAGFGCASLGLLALGFCTGGMRRSPRAALRRLSPASD